MNSYYTNVQTVGSKIYYRGVEHGKRVRRKLDYFPTFFVSSKEPTSYTTIHNQHVGKINPGNIADAKEFIKRYENVENFKIYGNTKYEYAFIYENFKEDIHWKLNDIVIANFDIEVESENGFPEPDDALYAIISITLKTNTGKFIVFGCGDFNNTRSDVSYIKCDNEVSLLKAFLREWITIYPDIMTGWNIKLFDIPYLINRIRLVLGEAYVKMFSPWGIIRSREVNYGGNRLMNTYIISGISCIDYIDIYQKYAPFGKQQPSYKLDSIAHFELQERKLSYEEYGNLHSLYLKNYQLFIEYNIKDVELVEKLDKKLRLLELVLTLAYDSKTNYDDVFAQTRMWDQIVYCYLSNENVVIPMMQKHSKDHAYIGAYVKDPQVGLHNWVASFDLTSLYPSLIMQYNISPEMLVQEEEYTSEMKELSNKASLNNLLYEKLDTDYLKDHDITLTPNGQFFRTKQQGFMSIITEKMFSDRQMYKKKMLQAKKELEAETDEGKRHELEDSISRYDNLQLAKKVCLNSLYGSMGTPYFRFFDLRMATAITTSGQLSIRWIEDRINDYLNNLLHTEKKDYVIGSDTDSIYLCLDGLIMSIIGKKANDNKKKTIQQMDKICSAKIQPFIDTCYSNLARYVNAIKQTMIMKREALCDRAIWVAKKRYILNVYNNEGVEYAKPKIKVTGLEVKKSSTPDFFRSKLEDCIEIILNKTEDDLIDYVSKAREEMEKVDITEISFPRGVNGVTKYTDEDTGECKSKTPIHVRGAIVYNGRIKKLKLQKKYDMIKDGEKIKFIYLKVPNTLRSDILSFPMGIPEEFKIKEYIDYDVQFNKAFIEPLKIITDSIQWKCEEESSLKGFFT